MSEPTFLDRVRDWLGAHAFRLTCWLYGLDPQRTFLEPDSPEESTGK